MKTSRWNPPQNAAAKTKNIEKNPAKGGIPYIENNAWVISSARRGLVRENPL